MLAYWLILAGLVATWFGFRVWQRRAKRDANTRPVIRRTAASLKWVSLALAVLTGLEIIAREAISVYAGAQVEGATRECVDTTEESWCAETDAYRKRWRAIDCDYVPDCSPNAPWRAQHARWNAEHEAKLPALLQDLKRRDCESKAGTWNAAAQACKTN